jgi:hypothetical protein
MAALQDFYLSPKYQALKTLRLRCTRVEGIDP